MNEPASDIRYLNRNEIDTAKWDHCILLSPNGLIYARSFYLDSMAKNWSALVLNDYEAVMPLTWNRKYGFTYLYQPAFTAQLGIFSQVQAGRNMLESFISRAKSHFRFCEIHLNYANTILEIPVRANYILDLGKPYEEIRKGYKKRLIKNLQESDLFELNYVHAGDYGSAIRLFKKEYSKRFSQIRSSDYQHFEKLCRDLLERNLLFIREVRDNRDALLDISIFFKDENRIYKIMSATSKTGREKRSHFYLVDQLIREFSTKKLLLDFEGSDVPGIAEFNRKFGSGNQPYPFFHYNNLPLLIRYFKRSPVY